MKEKDTSWNAYEKLVLSELADLKLSVATINVTMAKMSTRVSIVELKAGIWGAAGGLIISLPVAYEVLKHLR